MTTEDEVQQTQVQDQPTQAERLPPPQQPLVPEDGFNLERAATIKVDLALGTLGVADLGQIATFAKTMSRSESMVPAFMRHNGFVCMGIVMQAVEWGMSPYSVARQAYEVTNNKTGERTTAYMSQLLHAVLERRAPLKERLRVRYEGEGDDMVCIVWGTFKGEEEPREWRSEKLSIARNGKRSPLWQSKPKVQMFHDTSRDWGRIYCPDIVMGIYGKDEMEDVGFVDTKPEPRGLADDGGLTKRLSESALRNAGFSPTFAAEAIDDTAIAGDTAPQADAVSFPASGAGDDGAHASSPASSPSLPLAENASYQADVKALQDFVGGAVHSDGSDKPQPASDEAEATTLSETNEASPRASTRRARPVQRAG